MESKSRSELANSIRNAYQKDERIKRGEIEHKKQQKLENEEEMKKLVKLVFDDVENVVLKHIEELFTFEVKKISDFSSKSFVFAYEEYEETYEKSEYPDIFICLKCREYSEVNLIIPIKEIIKKHFNSIEKLALLANNPYYSYYLKRGDYKVIFARMIRNYATQKTEFPRTDSIKYIILCSYMSFEVCIEHENTYHHLVGCGLRDWYLDRIYPPKVNMKIKINKEKLYD